MLCCNAVGGGGIFRRVDVEKRIDRLGGPVRQCDAVPRRPDLDLAQVLHPPLLSDIPEDEQAAGTLPQWRSGDAQVPC